MRVINKSAVEDHFDAICKVVPDDLCAGTLAGAMIEVAIAAHDDAMSSNYATADMGWDARYKHGGFSQGTIDLLSYLHPWLDAARTMYIVTFASIA